MKNNYQNLFRPITLVLLLLLSAAISAQTCDDPTVLLTDDMESYSPGEVSAQSDHWVTWPNAISAGEVSSDFALSGTQSIKLDGTVENQDALFVLGDYSSGHFIVRWDMYIPAGKRAAFSLHHLAPIPGEAYWGFDADFQGNGQGLLGDYLDDLGNYQAPFKTFSYPNDEWFEVFLFADIDADEARVIIDEVTYDVWPFMSGTGGPGGISNPFPSSHLNSINFYPQFETALFYLDNIDFLEIPTAETGQYCYTAVEAVIGFNAVPELTCFGAGYDLGGGGSNGDAGYWFTYTAASDGILSIASCNGGVDSRGWIFDGGDCHNLAVKGVNDDQCDIGNGSIWATYREAIVIAGETYYIMWDNAWENTAFLFELGLSTDDPEPGNFCESAIEIVLGEQITSVMDGHAAMAGPNINNTTSSTTNYAQSEWYVYTPDIAGVASVSSCDGAISDTHVYIYTGECGNFETLSLLADNRNGVECPGDQSYIEFDVVAGTSYYIEWMDRWAIDAFAWELCLDGNCIPVAVNEAELKDGVQLFPNPVNDILNLQFDLPETAENIQISLVDAIGTKLLQRDLGMIQRGTYSLNVADLPVGLYFVQIATGTKQISKKVVLE